MRTIKNDVTKNESGKEVLKLQRQLEYWKGQAGLSPAQRAAVELTVRLVCLLLPFLWLTFCGPAACAVRCCRALNGLGCFAFRFLLRACCVLVLPVQIYRVSLCGSSQGAEHTYLCVSAPRCRCNLHGIKPQHKAMMLMPTGSLAAHCESLLWIYHLQDIQESRSAPSPDTAAGTPR